MLTFFTLGGMFGFVRVAVGPYFGFMVGCCDVLQYLLLAAISAYTLGKLLTFITDGSSQMEPLYWLLLYFPSVCVQISGGNSLWITVCATSTIVFLILALYGCSTITQMNFPANVLRNDPNSGGSTNVVSDFFRFLPPVNGFFVGISAVMLGCDYADKVRLFTYLAIDLTSSNLLYYRISHVDVSNLIYFFKLNSHEKYCHARWCHSHSQRFCCPCSSRLQLHRKGPRSPMYSTTCNRAIAFISSTN